MTSQGTHVTPPLRVEAEGFVRAMTAGRNRAVLVVASSAGGMVECVLKFSDCLGGTAPVPHLIEWFAAALGRLLGVDVEDPYEVVVTSAFAESLEEPWRAVALRSLGSAFGSGFRGAPYTQWTRGQRVPMELRPAAVELVAFDVLIHNVDRRVENPNLLVSREKVLAFDHGDAFAFVWPILAAPDPAIDSLPTVVDNHVFSKLLARKIPSLDRFREAVRNITDEVLEAVGQATPPAWQVGLANGKLGAIIDVMKRRRDAVDQWLPQVEACLRK